MFYCERGYLDCLIAKFRWPPNIIYFRPPRIPTQCFIHFMPWSLFLFWALCKPKWDWGTFLLQLQLSFNFLIFYQMKHFTSLPIRGSWSQPLLNRPLWILIACWQLSPKRPGRHFVAFGWVQRAVEYRKRAFFIQLNF
jgi:hypothetical protein